MSKLKQNKEKWELYQKHFNEFVQLGVLEKVHDTNPADPAKQYYYLGHRLVKSASKWRLVIDPSMKMANK